MACSPRAELWGTRTHWAIRPLARAAAQWNFVRGISKSTVHRWLSQADLKPHRVRRWLHSPDPDFRAKVRRIVRLYLHPPRGTRVICADEKTSIQARCRCHPTLPPGRARLMRVEHEYQRGGALAYLAAYDVHRAHVSGRCEPTTGIVPFGRLVEQVMTSPTHASAERVFWIVDNGSSHRGQASIDRLQGEWHNLRLIHLPVHASWLNQVGVAHNGMIFNVVTTENTGEVSPKNVDKSQHCCSVSTCRGDVTLRRTSRRPWLKRRSLDGVWHRQALDTVGV